MNYHSGGGLVVVAKDREDAERIISKDKYIKLTEQDWEDVLVYKLADNYTSEMFVFPDAGCC
jgi:hypothetical protein